MPNEPGWYADPVEPELRERYWLGSRWSDSRVRVVQDAARRLLGTSVALDDDDQPDDDESLEDARDDEATLAVDRVNITRRAATLSGVAQFLEVGAVVSFLLGTVAGIALAVQTSTDVNGHTTHPYAAVGVLVVLGAIGAGLIYFALARASRLFADYASFRTRTAYRSLDILFNGRTARNKECPDCPEDVWEEARLCPFCKHRFVSE
jgi:hypothetical protein